MLKTGIGGDWPRSALRLATVRLWSSAGSTIRCARPSYKPLVKVMPRDRLSDEDKLVELKRIDAEALRPFF